MVDVLLLFTVRTGHEHPHLNAAFANYMGLLAALGHEERESKIKIEWLIEAVKRRAIPKRQAGVGFLFVGSC